MALAEERRRGQLRWQAGAAGTAAAGAAADYAIPRHPPFCSPCGLSNQACSVNSDCCTGYGLTCVVDASTGGKVCALPPAPPIGVTMASSFVPGSTNLQMDVTAIFPSVGPGGLSEWRSWQGVTGEEARQARGRGMLPLTPIPTLPVQPSPTSRSLPSRPLLSLCPTQRWPQKGWVPPCCAGLNTPPALGQPG